MGRFLSRFGGFPPSRGIDFVGLEGAYSLSKLSSASTLAVRVRRSGDNAEQDFGFDGVDLNVSGLESWVTAGGGDEDGFVTTWYDQSINGYHVSQSNTDKQPQIVDAGSVFTLGGRATMLWYKSTDGTILDRLANFNFNENNFAFLAVIQLDVAGSSDTSRCLGIFPGDAGPSDVFIILNARRNNGNWGFQSELADTQLVTGTDYLLGLFKGADGIDGDFYLNSDSDGTFTDISISSISEIIMGGNGNASYFTGFWSEVLLYNQDKQSSRTAIENNINNYYSIY